MRSMRGGVAMIEIEPSPSVERAKQMLRDPDGYYAEARARAAKAVRAERAARLRRTRGTGLHPRSQFPRFVRRLLGLSENR